MESMSRKFRVLRLRLYCLNLNSDLVHSIAHRKATDTGVAVCLLLLILGRQPLRQKGAQWVRIKECVRNLRDARYVHFRRIAGLPKRGDPHGNGAAIVVRVRESLAHGEGQQVVSIDKEGVGA